MTKLLLLGKKIPFAFRLQLTCRRGINVGSRFELEQLNRVISANQMRFGEIRDRKFSFGQASEAFAHLWSRKRIGKIVIELSK